MRRASSQSKSGMTGVVEDLSLESKTCGLAVSSRAGQESAISTRDSPFQEAPISQTGVSSGASTVGHRTYTHYSEVA